MRQTACAWRFLPAIIGGGTWEGAHARPTAGPKEEALEVVDKWTKAFAASDVDAIVSSQRA